MAFLKVLSCSLILIVAATPFIDAQLPILPKFDESHNIHFVLYVNDDVFDGEYNASIYIPYKTQDIFFYTENLSIIKIMVTNNTQRSKENKEKVSVHSPEKFIYDIETYLTTISFPYDLSSGYYNLNMKFSGLLAEDGGFRTYINKDHRVWLIHYHTFATRRLFPVLNDTLYSTLHASYNISIKHHKNYTALSNMNIKAINMDENNMQWTRFKVTPPMPVYFIAAGVTHFASISETNQSTRLWCRTNMLSHVQFAYSVVKNVTLFLDNKLPYSRKTSEINHVAIPKLLAEREKIKLGIVFYGEADIIFNHETDSEIRNIEITQVIAYKVVHEWLYNTIDRTKWEPWLSKGFATFFGIYVANEIFPQFRIQDFFVIQMQHDVLHWSTKDTWPLTIESEFNNFFEISRYIKASIMFRTLQVIFIEEMLQYNIKWYLQDLYVSSSIFWNITQSVVDESPFDITQSIVDESPFEIIYNLKDWITNWTQLNYYPVINVKRIDTNWVNVSMENSTNMWIFVNITTQTHSNLNKTLPIVWLTPRNPYQLQTIDFIDKNDWILIYSQQSGRYRVNYDAENWDRLSKHLNSNSFKKIHVLDRAKIIDDAFHFLMTGRLNSTVFLDISHYLWRDTDYIAWYPMFKNLEYMSGFFAFSESAPVKKEIMQPLSEILWEVKYPEFKSDIIIQKSFFTKSLRQEAARWLCILGHDDCLSKAYNDLKLYIYNRNNFSPYKIWMGWKEWTFCSGLKIADNDIWMKVFDVIYLNESDFSVLKFLACSNSSSMIVQYMHLMANATTVIDHINSFCSIVARHANNIYILDFILYNLERIKPIHMDVIPALTMIINHVYSKQQIERIKEYVKSNIQDVLKYSVLAPINDGKNDDEVIESLRKKKIKSIITYVNRKLDLRWNQIRNQLYEYRYLIKDFGDVFRAYLAN